MKLYQKTIPTVARDIVQALLDAGDIEVDPEVRDEACEDFAAILREYQRRDEEVAGAARDLVTSRGWSQEKFAEAKRMVAHSRGFAVGDEALDYVLNQMLEFMMMSNHIEEVWAEDHVMRKRMADVIRRHLGIHDEIEAEVRRQLKHLEEGTRDWEIQYQRVMEQVRRRRGLL